MRPEVGGFEKTWNRDCLAPCKLKDRIVNRDILVKNGIDPDQFIRKIRHMSPTRMCLTFKLDGRWTRLWNHELVGNLASGFSDSLHHEGLYVGRQACERQGTELRFGI